MLYKEIKICKSDIILKEKDIFGTFTTEYRYSKRETESYV